MQNFRKTFFTSFNFGMKVLQAKTLLKTLFILKRNMHKLRQIKLIITLMIGVVF